MLFYATMVTGGENSKKSQVILNSAIIIGISPTNRVLMNRDIIDEISKQEFNAVNKISHFEVTAEVAQSLLGTK